jgi:hypothetical protein
MAMKRLRRIIAKRRKKRDMNVEKPVGWGRSKLVHSSAKGIRQRESHPWASDVNPGRCLPNVVLNDRLNAVTVSMRMTRYSSIRGELIVDTIEWIIGPTGLNIVRQCSSNEMYNTIHTTASICPSVSMLSCIVTRSRYSLLLPWKSMGKILFFNWSAKISQMTMTKKRIILGE